MRTGNKVKRSYSISDSTNQRLNELSEMWKMPKTRVLERLIRNSPDVHPQKKVTVFSSDPLIVGVDENWTDPYTGYVLIDFPKEEGVKQVVLHVQEMTYTRFADFLSDRDKIKEILFGGEH